MSTSTIIINQQSNIINVKQTSGLALKLEYIIIYLEMAITCCKLGVYPSLSVGCNCVLYVTLIAISSPIDFIIASSITYIIQLT